MDIVVPEMARKLNQAKYHVSNAYAMALKGMGYLFFLSFFDF